ncbi:hypothetical protein GS425_17295 [Rhodococcus hoagii]|nr:hypothetical protein [Prescottella equi]
MTAITRRSPFTGQTNAREINVAEEKIIAWENTPRQQRPFVQDFFPELSADDREFILTGITPEEWEGLVPDESDED